MEPLKISSWAVVFVSLAFAALFALAAPLLKDHVLGVSDARLHAMWTHEFASALADGVFIPRWVTVANGGLGEPAFLYLHPGYYYAASALFSTGLSLKFTTFGTLFISNIALGLVTFHYLRRNFTWITALIGALLVQATPSLAGLGQMYGAYPWYFSTFGAAVSIFETAALLQDQSTKRIRTIAVGVFLTTVCHVLTSFMVLLCCGGALLAMIAFSHDSRFRVQILRSWIIGVAIGLGLAGFYLIPALFLQRYVSPSNWLVSGHIDWQNSFLFPIFSAHTFGTHWNAFQYYFPGVSIGMFFAGGILAWLSRSRVESSAKFYLFCGGFSLILGSEVAFPLWEHVEAFQRLQRGYRFQVILALCAVAFMVTASGRDLIWRRPTVVGFVWLAMIAITVATTIGINLKVASGEGVRIADAFSFAKNNSGPREYATAIRGPKWQSYLTQGGLAGYCLRQELECVAVDNKAHELNVQVSSERTNRLVLPRFSFPFWDVFVDGSLVPLEYETETGLISVPVQSGVHSILVRYRRMDTEIVGLCLSLICLALVVFGLPLLQRRWHRETYVVSPPPQN